VSYTNHNLENRKAEEKMVQTFAEGENPVCVAIFNTFQWSFTSQMSSRKFTLIGVQWD